MKTGKKIKEVVSPQREVRKVQLPQPQENPTRIDWGIRVDWGIGTKKPEKVVTYTEA